MLSLVELVSLERSLRSTSVLSVYLAGVATDPALHDGWRLQLDHELAAVRGRLDGASHEQREAFEACVRELDRELAAPRSRAESGWVAFVTPDGVRHAGPLHTDVPALAVWGRSAFIAPYLRALRESRPVVLAVVDARKADVYRYHAGALSPVSTLRTPEELRPLAHMGDAPRVGFHSGTRGIAGRDAAQRARRAEMARMIGELAERVRTLAGDDAWVVIGGIPRVVAHAVKILDVPAARVLPLDALDVHSSLAQITATARAAATTLRDASVDLQLEELEADAEAGTLAVLGRSQTLQALRCACVRTLFVSERWSVEHPADVTRLVRRALDQDASVEELAREPGMRLDTLGGIAAALRYRPADLGDTARLTDAAGTASRPM